MLNERSWWRAMPIGVSCLSFARRARRLVLVAWHEEQFPFLKTVVQPVRIPKAR